jgi:hypothetical protein
LVSFASDAHTRRREWEEVRVDRRQIALLGLTEEVTGDLVAWCLLLLGVVFGLGTLGAVELLTLLSKSH